ncbi:hypothetical protein BSQ40_18725 [Serratia fonticola]|nr:hypothetical protein BSQ40_18725 [Serratia fonticola]
MSKRKARKLKRSDGMLMVVVPNRSQSLPAVGVMIDQKALKVAKTLEPRIQDKRNKGSPRNR